MASWADLDGKYPNCGQALRVGNAWSRSFLVRSPVMAFPIGSWSAIGRKCCGLSVGLLGLAQKINQPSRHSWGKKGTEDPHQSWRRGKISLVSSGASARITNPGTTGMATALWMGKRRKASHSSASLKGTPGGSWTASVITSCEDHISVTYCFMSASSSTGLASAPKWFLSWIFRLGTFGANARMRWCNLKTSLCLVASLAACTTSWNLCLRLWAAYRLWNLRRVQYLVKCLQQLNHLRSPISGVTAAMRLASTKWCHLDSKLWELVIESGFTLLLRERLESQVGWRITDLIDGMTTSCIWETWVSSGMAGVCVKSSRQWWAVKRKSVQRWLCVCQCVYNVLRCLAEKPTCAWTWCVYLVLGKCPISGMCPYLFDSIKGASGRVSVSRAPPSALQNLVIRKSIRVAWVSWIHVGPVCGFQVLSTTRPWSLRSCMNVPVSAWGLPSWRCPCHRNLACPTCPGSSVTPQLKSPIKASVLRLGNWIKYWSRVLQKEALSFCLAGVRSSMYW